MNIKLIEHIKKFFHENGYNFALVGGYALHAYGYTRATKDIDFVTDSKNHEQIKKMLTDLGFHAIQEDDSFAIFINDIAKDRIDFMYVDAKTSRILFGNTQEKEINGLVLPVVSPSHLAMMKLFAASQDAVRRARDLEDVHQLFLRNVLEEKSLKEMLMKYDLLNYFNDITAR